MPSEKIVNQIQYPRDLRNLDLSVLPQLCSELRDELIGTVSQIGGHFASSLGVVELTVGLHFVFNTPRDQLVWDVGHQAYIHKMLTGRREDLKRIRKLGGISGFPRRNESEFDTFGVAHAGTSISAASGMLEAFEFEYGTEDVPRAVAVIGDGALTCGMAFEALNHAGQLHRKLIVVLNDNGMSIAQNVGALSWAFSKTVTGRFSTSARRRIKNLVSRGYVPQTFYEVLDRTEEATQGFLSPPAMLFSSFGFRYMGPVDGHDIDQVVKALEQAKNQDGPVVVHLLTDKGKGYQPAEEDPVTYHGVSPFAPKTGSFGSNGSAKPKPRTYTEVFSNALADAARENDKVVAITAAMPDGTGLTSFAKEFPERTYDVGICEQHAVTFAAGLATQGYRPVCAIYSTFLQRAYDQVVHDVCIQSLPVIFAIDRGGLVGEDGPTHHGVFDFAYLRTLPNMVVLAPRNAQELRDMLFTAIDYHRGPVAIRYPRGSANIQEFPHSSQEIAFGSAELLVETPASNVLLVGIGATVETCLEAAKTLNATRGIPTSVVNARSVKPLDAELLSELFELNQLVVTVEEHALQGGFGSAVAEMICDLGINTKLSRLGIPDEFIEHGSQSELRKICAIDPESVVKTVVENLPISSASNGRPISLSASEARPR